MFSYSISIIFMAGSIASLAAAQIILKWRFGHRLQGAAHPISPTEFITTALSDYWIWLGVTLIVLGALMWYAALTRLPLSFMMPIASLVAPITVVCAYVFLKEPLTAGQVAAIAMIAVGVAWLSYQQ